MNPKSANEASGFYYKELWTSMKATKEKQTLINKIGSGKRDGPPITDNDWEMRKHTEP